MGLRSSFLIALITLSFFSSLSYAQELTEKRPVFKLQKIKVKNKTIQVEIADTDEKRSYGLMHKTSLPPDQGMLFVFDSPQTLNFWMKNTFLDLSIGYFDGQKTLVDIQEMKGQKSVMAQDLKSYPSASPAQYALEMSKGWFAKNKIKVGDKFDYIKK